MSIFFLETCMMIMCVMELMISAFILTAAVTLN